MFLISKTKFKNKKSFEKEIYKDVQLAPIYFIQ